MSPSTITRDELAELHSLERAFTAANKAMDTAKAARDKKRAELLERIPPSSDPDERKKGVHATAVGGITVKLTPSSNGDSFRLKEYREAGGHISKLMARFITPARSYFVWTVGDPPASASAPAIPRQARAAAASAAKSSRAGKSARSARAALERSSGAV